MSDGTAQKRVIFDTDMGADDAWALQMILKAEKLLQNVKVLAITTVHGNTSAENAVKNTYRILDGLNRTDVPIYKGATEAIIPGGADVGQYYGVNGFSDVEFWESHYPTNINEIIQQKNALEIIRKLVMENPQEISLICVGPLTNIGLAIKAYPEIKENIKDIFIMGGNTKGRGNSLKGSEFNFYKDPEAAHIVLNSLNCPITMVAFESGLEESISIPLDWRFNVLGNADCRNVKLLNEVERIAFRNRQLYTPFDALLVAIYLHPEKCIRTKYSYNATVELQGLHTRGQMILDRRSNKHNVSVIELLNEEEIKKLLHWTAYA